MSYKIDWEERGVVLSFAGGFGNDDFIQANIELYEDPRFACIRYQIFDLLEVASYPVDSNAIRKIAELDAIAFETNPNIKVAVVANKLVVKGLLNMYNAYFEIAGNQSRWESEMFDTVEDARKWLAGPAA